MIRKPLLSKKIIAPLTFMALLPLILPGLSCHRAHNDGKQEGGGTALLDSFFTGAISNHKIPSAAVFLAVDGNIVYRKAFGMKNMATGEALDIKDIFRIASMTKAVTSLAAMQLVERGLIRTDDPVKNYLPEFSDPTVLTEILPDSSFTSRPANGDITIHHLLTHTSGIGYGFQSDLYNSLIIKHGITEGFEERPIRLRDNVRALAELPLLHDPGAKFTYGLNMDVLGAVIEVVSGETLDSYFQNHIFEPLGMNDTYFYLPEEKATRLVTVHEYNEERTGFIPATYPYTQYPVRGAKTYLSGGADLSSTTDDMGIFALMMLDKGMYNGTRILGSRFLEMMTSRQTNYSGWNSDVGYGVSITNALGASNGTLPEGTYGWGGFFDTYSWVDPGKNLVGVLLLQMYPTNEFRVHENFQEIVYRIADELKYDASHPQ